MKGFFILAPLLLLIISGCNEQPKHPQANLIKQASATSMTDKSIIEFTDSLNAAMPTFDKETSLIYQKDGVSMYVEKYSRNGKPLLYVQHLNNASISNNLKSYYFKNDSLILIRESLSNTKDTPPSYTESRTYLRNNIVFKKDYHKASSLAALKRQPYTAPSTAKTNPEEVTDYTKLIAELDQMLMGTGPFELFFDQIISLPEERTIQLKSKDRNGYSANIVVNQVDIFIGDLLRNSSKYKNTPLKLKWKIVDQEAVYIPADSLTREPLRH